MNELIEKTKEILTPENVNNYYKVDYFGERFIDNIVNNYKKTSTYNNGEYWIDEIGNYYLNEMDYIQTIGKLKAFNQIEKRTDFGKKWISVEDADDETFLNLVSSLFERIGKHSVFSAFYHDLRSYPDFAVKALIHIKCFFHFFLELERIMEENQLSWIGFLINDAKFRILFSNFCFTDVSFNKKFNFNRFRNNIIDFTRVIKQIPYELCLATLAFQIPPSNELESQKGAILRRPCFKNNADYRDICLKITIALVRYIRAECDEAIKSQIESDQVKNILFWIDAKYKNYEKARQEFEEMEEDIKSEFKKLIETVNNNNNLSLQHKFRNCFSAAYHCQQHCIPIWDYMKNFDPPEQNLPLLYKQNIERCVKFYLRYVPDKIFHVTQSCKREIHQYDTTLQNYRFKYRNQIFGIKYKKLDEGDAGHNDNGYAILDQLLLEGTWISTMHEIWKKRNRDI